MCITVFSLVFSGIFSYVATENIVYGILEKEVGDNLAYATSQIDSLLEESEKMIDYYRVDESFLALLGSFGQSAYSDAVARLKINRQLNSITTSRSNIMLVYLIIDENLWFASDTSLINPSHILSANWYAVAQETRNQPIYISPYNIVHFEMKINATSSNKALGLAKNIYDINSGRAVGVMGVDIRADLFDSLLCSSIGQHSTSLLIDSDGRIAYGTDRSMIGSVPGGDLEGALHGVSGSYIHDEKDEKRLIAYDTVDSCGWKLIQILPLKEIRRPISSIGVYLLFFGIILIFVAVVFSYLLSRNITRPVTVLSKHVKKLEKGDFTQLAMKVGGDEIGDLVGAYNHMVLEIQNLISAITEKEREKRLSELRTLQQQITPHFLYNTLDSVNWLARMQGNSRISGVITALNRLLRKSIFNGSEYLSVHDEIECVENYVSLQSFRYGKEISVCYNIEGEAGDCLIRKLIIQPIVENSILHGYREITRGMELSVDIRINDGMLLAVVTDNGVGMARELIDSVLNSSDTRRERFSGIGIANIIERIRINYGPPYGLSIESARDAGTTVTLRLPVITEKPPEVENA